MWSGISGRQQEMNKKDLDDSKGSAEPSMLECAAGHCTLVVTKSVFQLLEVLIKP